MRESIECEVRSYELDSYNHVNNAVYLQYLEFARMEYLRRVGFDYTGLVAEGYMLYVTHIDIHYKHSARLFDKLHIDIEPIKLGKVSGTFRQIITNSQGKVCAEAEVSWGCVDKAGKPARLPDKYIVQGLVPTQD